MKLLKYFIGFIIIFGTLATESKAAHLVGGDLSYECVGPNTYRITLTIYRDCNCVSCAPFDPQAAITIRENLNNTLIMNLNVSIGVRDTIPVVISNPCLQTPPNVCTEQAVYDTTVTLSPAFAVNGFSITHQRCCRNNTINNILNPGSSGTTYTIDIPPTTTTTCNSSPVFTNKPPVVLCLNDDLVFDHSATDADGDSLFYELCDPLLGASTISPVANPADPPPYSTIAWANGFSTLNPITGNPSFAIDPNTGIITGTPTMSGQYVFSVCVSEFRNGVLLDIATRDYQFNVVSCGASARAVIVDQLDTCVGLDVTFDHNSTLATNVFWDFGDTTTTADTSIQQTPSYTYPDTGIYIVMLIVNPGTSCTDTVFHTYRVFYPVNAIVPAVPPQCVDGNSFDFDAKGAFGPHSEFFWEFGPSAIPSTSTEKNPTNIVFQDSGHFPIRLTITQFGCSDSDIGNDTVVVYPPPEIGFIIPDTVGCAPFEIQFIDSSLAWTDINYEWDFGDGNTSNEENPIHIYDTPGLYDVTLTIYTTSGCVDTLTMVKSDAIRIHPSPSASMQVNPTSASEYNPFINITNTSTGFTSFEIHTGDGEIYSENNSIRHEYTDTGNFIVETVVINDFGCTDTARKIIRIEPESELHLPNAFTPEMSNNFIFLPGVRRALKYEFIVLNRWGQVIFETKNPEEGWNGTFQGTGTYVPAGVYVYIIKMVNADKTDRIVRGNITVIR